MFIDEFRDYCLSKPGATEETPFGPDVLVFKIAGKIFALLPFDGQSANLKCDPERALELRDEYPDHVLPGYHMNKKHWNTIILRGALSNKLLCELIDHSYALVAPKPKKPPKRSKP